MRRYEWDVFISHASEDKDLVARPLAAELTQRGLRVWYDETTLHIGDSLRQSIDFGLSRSRYGVVILSHAFFSKAWPQRELDGISTRELAGKKVLLPVWHGVTWNDVLQYSPTLADRLATSTSQGIAKVASDIMAAIGAERFSWERTKYESSYEDESDRPLKPSEVLRTSDFDYSGNWGSFEFIPNPVAPGQYVTVKLRFRKSACGFNDLSKLDLFDWGLGKAVIIIEDEQYLLERGINLSRDR